jgi:hypothetical protein
MPTQTQWYVARLDVDYPDQLDRVTTAFRYVVGVGRWALRVTAYATLLVTDRYPGPGRASPVRPA